MSKAAKMVNIGLFCVWIFLIALVLYRNYTGTSIEKAVALEGSIEKTTNWYDIYAGPKKIGFAHTLFEKVGNEIIIRREREIKVVKDGQETILYERLRCLTDLSYSMKSFEYTSHFKDEKGIKLTGEVDAGEVLFFLESADKRKTHKTPAKGREVYLPITFISALVQQNPVPGSVYTVPMLDFDSLSIKDLRVSLEEVRPIKVGANIRSLYKFKAGGSVWWSDEKGIIVKEKNPSGMTLYSQDEAIAKDPSDRTLFDYAVVPFFKSDRMLPNAENLRILKIRIEGFPLNSHLYEASQVSLKDDTLTIRKEDLDEIKKRSYRLPYTDASLQRYLTADKWIMSENKTIKGNAENMVTIEKNDAFRFARYLNSNLFFTVKSIPLFTLLNSMETFHERSGDHLQRSAMFASFARAAGLPTRLAGGLVYRNGYFYFHTWPEVWFDKWIPIDPTLAQFPADVTHIPLKEGTVEDIISIVNDLKSITVEILEAS